jgi:paraquat-inducible protein A
MTAPRPRRPLLRAADEPQQAPADTPASDEDTPTHTGQQHRVYSCTACGCVSKRTADAPPASTEPLRCPRCLTALHHRRPRSLEQTWAYTLAALLLYLPANLLPVMATSSVFGSNQHTLLGGIHELWVSGDWALALIVFVASIAVPLIKIGVLLLLLVTAQRQSRWRSQERTQLYRLLDAVGHWSMLDVFVVVMLVGMMNFGNLASVQPEAGLLAFGAVVVLTIFAVISFDPRLLWPEPQRDTLTTAPPA